MWWLMLIHSEENVFLLNSFHDKKISMKNSLPILVSAIVIVVGSFTISNSKTESLHNFNTGKSFIAVVCGIDSGLIRKEDLLQCPGITTIDASTHKKTHHDVISFEIDRK